MEISVSDWMDDRTGPEYVWYVKRLSGNDTLANGSHQAGPYIPREFFLSLFPSLNDPNIRNPEKHFDMYIDSHSDYREIRAIWYNNRYFGGTRNEARMTNFGGRDSALLDPESTGALTVFAFQKNSQGEAEGCYVWVCKHETEEELVEDRIGPIEPGQARLFQYDSNSSPEGLFADSYGERSSCWLRPEQLPPEWLLGFPSGAEIVNRAVLLRVLSGMTPDQRLIKRRECEFEIFRSVEEAIELPHIQSGFASIEEFVNKAQTILQRRKARSGRSLELHAKAIFIEENLVEETDFSYQPIIDMTKRPDFIFPSEESYSNLSFPSERLRMLAVKTTCKDRWRQILNEADRVDLKHLLTLQEGVSENQFSEMQHAGVQLVVPNGLMNKFPSSVQPHLQSLESFIGDVRLLRL